MTIHEFYSNHFPFRWFRANVTWFRLRFVRSFSLNLPLNICHSKNPISMKFVRISTGNCTKSRTPFIFHNYEWNSCRLFYPVLITFLFCGPFHKNTNRSRWWDLFLFLLCAHLNDESLHRFIDALRLIGIDFSISLIPNTNANVTIYLRIGHKKYHHLLLKHNNRWNSSLELLQTWAIIIFGKYRQKILDRKKQTKLTDLFCIITIK